MNSKYINLACNLCLKLCILCILNACQTLPSLEGRSIETHIAADIPSSLAYANASLVNQHPGLSGLYPLDDGYEAFAARLALIRAAEHSLDVQYYIWRNDTSGQLLFHELVLAAQRGVHIRLLLDDNNTVGLDKVLTALNQEPNIQIRLFNPFMHRHWRALSYLTDFARLNRRMHNKSITADNQITILGGRNIGDEYFDMGKGTLFVDLDILTIGPIVNQVSNNFDRYWNSASAYDFSKIVHRRNKLQASTPVFKRRSFNYLRADSYDNAYNRDNFINRLLDGSLNYQWAHLILVSDNPDKALPKGKNQSDADQPADSLLVASETVQSPVFKYKKASLTLNELIASVVEPQKDLLIITPYFVPTQTGLEYLFKLREEGVRVRILTNSLAATDVPAVHSGYAHYRIPLLKEGVEIYELKNQGFLKGPRDRAFTGNSESSLHAKTFTIDGQQLYIGSLNFDPRSARLNTEMGVVIQSPEMAKFMNQAINEALPDVTYQVKLSAQGKLEWLKTNDKNQTKVYHHEPDTSIWQRVWVKLLSWLPLESLL
ncbi:MAG: phospholipase D family protein [Snodgrassella sp.]|nr:phospholipase D family protein [Snodgrassella sp.]